MSILYKNSNGDITSLIPDMNNIDDSTVAADTTYSSEKIEGTYPITTTSTTSPISTANGKPRKLTIFGKSEIVDGAIKSAGEGWSVVRLADLTWQLSGEGPNSRFYATLPLSGWADNEETRIAWICNKYKSAFYSAVFYHTGDKILALNRTGASVQIYDSSYNNINDFIASLGDATLCYELADPSQGNTIAIKTDNGTGINGTMAVFTTGTPLYGVSDTIRDVMLWNGGTGEVTKNCDELDLGTLNWSYKDDVVPKQFRASLPQAMWHHDYNYVENIICPVYQTVSYYNFIHSGNDNLICRYYTSVDGINIVDNSCTTLTQFLDKINGVKLVYELATSTTIPLTQAENESIAGLKTYSPQTTITINDNPDYSIEAYANTANGQAAQSLETDIKLRIDEVKNEKNHFCYSYKIDLSDSNPATCVKPHFDTRYGCDNFSYTSAKMNYATGVFDYGSWEGFIRRIARPCMLKYDGTVDYYLDPDDYSKKITGEASDVADVNYQGNAMVELEKLYFKRYTYNGIQYCFISDRKLDKSFHCYAHHDKYGKELDYIYRACYDGMYDGTRLRSISGIDYHNLNALTAGYIMSNTTRQEEMNFAKANNVSTEQGEGWNILHKSEWDYINDILVLIGMSTDVQTTFGRGRDSGYVSTTDTGIISTGTMDDKGLFWGKNDGSAGVKVLGIENHWANLYKSMAGYINASGTQKIKQTYGTEDGSTVVGFNTDGTGYVAIVGATPTKGDSSASGGGYITAWKYNDYGLIPYECTSAGSSAKFIPDYFYFNNNQTNFALVGGASNGGLSCGAFCSVLSGGAGSRYWNFGAALSYKPLSAA